MIHIGGQRLRFETIIAVQRGEFKKLFMRNIRINTTPTWRSEVVALEAG